MKRMKNGTVGMEFSAATKGKGYTMRANISADCIRALKRWNKDSFGPHRGCREGREIRCNA